MRNERGVALVTVMLLSIVALAMTAGLLYMLARGGYVSGMQKQYKTALEAGVGGASVTFRAIAAGGNTGLITLTNPSVSDNLVTKLQNPTASWPAGVDNSLTINPSTASTYDLAYDLGNYRVYSKIVDTVTGNTGVDEGLAKSGVVSSTTGELVVVSNPYLYTVEVLAQRRTNPAERAKISVLYQY